MCVLANIYENILYIKKLNKEIISNFFLFILQNLPSKQQ